MKKIIIIFLKNIKQLIKNNFYNYKKISLATHTNNSKIALGKLSDINRRKLIIYIIVKNKQKNFEKVFN